MAPNEYTNALEKALGDLENKVLQRDLLNGEIFGLKETVRVLASRVELSVIEQDRIARLIAMVDSATPKLTDSIRTLLVREYPNTMTAIEVRNALEDSSDSEGISLSACHAALKRMLGDGEVKLGKQKNGKATYSWIGRAIPSANAYSFLRGRTVPDPPTGDPIEDAMNAITSPRAPVPPASMRKKLGLEK
jgi:hypothetical protein